MSNYDVGGGEEILHKAFDRRSTRYTSSRTYSSVLLSDYKQENLIICDRHSVGERKIYEDIRIVLIIACLNFKDVSLEENLLTTSHIIFTRVLRTHPKLPTAALQTKPSCSK